MTQYGESPQDSIRVYDSGNYPQDPIQVEAQGKIDALVASGRSVVVQYPATPGRTVYHAERPAFNAKGVSVVGQEQRQNAVDAFGQLITAHDMHLIATGILGEEPTTLIISRELTQPTGRQDGASYFRATTVGGDSKQGFDMKGMRIADGGKSLIFERPNSDNGSSIDQLNLTDLILVPYIEANVPNVNQVNPALAVLGQLAGRKIIKLG